MLLVNLLKDAADVIALVEHRADMFIVQCMERLSIAPVVREHVLRVMLHVAEISLSFPVAFVNCLCTLCDGPSGLACNALAVLLCVVHSHPRIILGVPRVWTTLLAALMAPFNFHLVRPIIDLLVYLSNFPFLRHVIQPQKSWSFIGSWLLHSGAVCKRRLPIVSVASITGHTVGGWMDPAARWNELKPYQKTWAPPPGTDPLWRRVPTEYIKGIVWGAKRSAAEEAVYSACPLAIVNALTADGSDGNGMGGSGNMAGADGGPGKRHGHRRGRSFGGVGHGGGANDANPPFVLLEEAALDYITTNVVAGDQGRIHVMHCLSAMCHAAFSSPTGLFLSCGGSSPLLRSFASAIRSGVFAVQQCAIGALVHVFGVNDPPEALGVAPGGDGDGGLNGTPANGKGMGASGGPSGHRAASDNGSHGSRTRSRPASRSGYSNSGSWLDGGRSRVNGRMSGGHVAADQNNDQRRAGPSDTEAIIFRKFKTFSVFSPFFSLVMCGVLESQILDALCEMITNAHEADQRLIYQTKAGSSLLREAYDLLTRLVLLARGFMPSEAFLVDRVFPLRADTSSHTNESNLEGFLIPNSLRMSTNVAGGTRVKVQKRTPTTFDSTAATRRDAAVLKGFENQSFWNRSDGTKLYSGAMRVSRRVDGILGSSAAFSGNYMVGSLLGVRLGRRMFAPLAQKLLGDIDYSVISLVQGHKMTQMEPLLPYEAAASGDGEWNDDDDRLSSATGSVTAGGLSGDYSQERSSPEACRDGPRENLTDGLSDLFYARTVNCRTCGVSSSGRGRGGGKGGGFKRQSYSVEVDTESFSSFGSDAQSASDSGGGYTYGYGSGAWQSGALRAGGARQVDGQGSEEAIRKRIAELVGLVHESGVIKSVSSGDVVADHPRVHEQQPAQKKRVPWRNRNRGSGSPGGDSQRSSLSIGASDVAQLVDEAVLLTKSASEVPVKREDYKDDQLLSKESDLRRSSVHVQHKPRRKHGRNRSLGSWAGDTDSDLSPSVAPVKISASDWSWRKVAQIAQLVGGLLPCGLGAAISEEVRASVSSNQGEMVPSSVVYQPAQTTGMQQHSSGSSSGLFGYFRKSQVMSDASQLLAFFRMILKFVSPVSGNFATHSFRDLRIIGEPVVQLFKILTMSKWGVQVIDDSGVLKHVGGMLEEAVAQVEEEDRKASEQAANGPGQGHGKDGDGGESIGGGDDYDWDPSHHDIANSEAAGSSLSQAYSTVREQSAVALKTVYGAYLGGEKQGRGGGGGRGDRAIGFRKIANPFMSKVELKRTLSRLYFDMIAALCESRDGADLFLMSDGWTALNRSLNFPSLAERFGPYLIPRLPFSSEKYLTLAFQMALRGGAVCTRIFSSRLLRAVSTGSLGWKFFAHTVGVLCYTAAESDISSARNAAATLRRITATSDGLEVFLDCEHAISKSALRMRDTWRMLCHVMRVERGLDYVCSVVDVREWALFYLFTGMELDMSRLIDRVEGNCCTPAMMHPPNGSKRHSGSHSGDWSRHGPGNRLGGGLGGDNESASTALRTWCGYKPLDVDTVNAYMQTRGRLEVPSVFGVDPFRERAKVAASSLPLNVLVMLSLTPRGRKLLAEASIARMLICILVHCAIHWTVQAEACCEPQPVGVLSARERSELWDVPRSCIVHPLWYDCHDEFVQKFAGGSSRFHDGGESGLVDRNGLGGSILHEGAGITASPLADGDYPPSPGTPHVLISDSDHRDRAMGGGMAASFRTEYGCEGDNAGSRAAAAAVGSCVIRRMLSLTDVRPNVVSDAGCEGVGNFDNYVFCTPESLENERMLPLQSTLSACIAMLASECSAETRRESSEWLASQAGRALVTGWSERVQKEAGRQRGWAPQVTDVEIVSAAAVLSQLVSARKMFECSEEDVRAVGPGCWYDYFRCQCGLDESEGMSGCDGPVVAEGDRRGVGNLSCNNPTCGRPFPEYNAQAETGWDTECKAVGGIPMEIMRDATIIADDSECEEDSDGVGHETAKARDVEMNCAWMTGADRNQFDTPSAIHDGRTSSPQRGISAEMHARNGLRDTRQRASPRRSSASKSAEQAENMGGHDCDHRRIPSEEKEELFRQVEKSFMPAKGVPSVLRVCAAAVIVGMIGAVHDECYAFIGGIRTIRTMLVILRMCDVPRIRFWVYYALSILAMNKSAARDLIACGWWTSYGVTAPADPSGLFGGFEREQLVPGGPEVVAMDDMRQRSMRPAMGAHRAHLMKSPPAPVRVPEYVPWLPQRVWRWHTPTSAGIAGDPLLDIMQARCMEAEQNMAGDQSDDGLTSPSRSDGEPSGREGGGMKARPTALVDMNGRALHPDSPRVYQCILTHVMRLSSEAHFAASRYWLKGLVDADSIILRDPAVVDTVHNMLALYHFSPVARRVLFFAFRLYPSTFSRVWACIWNELIKTRYGE